MYCMKRFLSTSNNGYMKYSYKDLEVFSHEVFNKLGITKDDSEIIAKGEY